MISSLVKINRRSESDKQAISRIDERVVGQRADGGFVDGEAGAKRKDEEAQTLARVARLVSVERVVGEVVGSLLSEEEEVVLKWWCVKACVKYDNKKKWKFVCEFVRACAAGRRVSCTQQSNRST